MQDAANNTVSNADGARTHAATGAREQLRRDFSPYFPERFLFGAATAAYQVEGAASTDGRGPSIWDAFCEIPGRVTNGDTGRTACDHYHRYREDVDLMRTLGLGAYRFSVSWPRVMPTGRTVANEAGLDFYDRLVDALNDAGIEPMVTLYHWDLPAALQDALGGWASDELPAIFADYAELVFRRLGDRVRSWITINEPWVVVDGGYFSGGHPPALRDRALGYRVGHNLLRAHAYAVERFRAIIPDGAISFALNTSYSFPASDSPDDHAAAQRAMENFGGWFGDPTVFGDYPSSMRERLGELLPRFTAEDTRLLKGSTDFLALNYYTSDRVRHAPDAGEMEIAHASMADFEHTEMDWPIVPDGFCRLLHWLSERYGRPPITITENGAALVDEPDESGFVNDSARIAYLRNHLAAVLSAIGSGVDVRGYFVWSLLDNLEWTHGFSKRFGIVRCDHQTQKRTIKASGKWYSNVVRTRRLDDVAACKGQNSS